jgi:hypothetical protein
MSEISTDGIPRQVQLPSFLNEVLDDLVGSIDVLELIEVGDPEVPQEGLEDLQGSLIGTEGVFGDLPMITPFRPDLKELFDLLGERDSVGEMDLVHQVLGVQVLLFLLTDLLVLGFQGLLDLSFGSIGEGDDGLVVPPLPILIEGTHNSDLRWMRHTYIPYYTCATPSGMCRLNRCISIGSAKIVAPDSF